MIERRKMLQIGGLGLVALWVWGAPKLPDLRRPAMTFAPIGDTGFRRLNHQASFSAIPPALIGIEGVSEATQAELCDVLRSPITMFWDVNCPNCLEMEARVNAEAGNNHIEFLPYPILGPSSVVAARAVAAARLQAADDALRQRLMELPGRPVRRAAQDLGLDVPKLLDAMSDPEVDAQLARSARVAARLGVIGTPGTVIGNTLLQGSLPPTIIRRIMDDEETWTRPCGES